MHSTNILSYICIYLAMHSFFANCASNSEAPFVFDPKAQITDAVAQQIHAQYPAFHGLAQEDLNKRLVGLINTFHGADPKERNCQTVALIQAGADPKLTTESRRTILERAVYYSPCNLIAYLLHKGADPYADAGLLSYPIFFLCKTVSMIKIFVQHGTDINANKGKTMLMHCISRNDVKINLLRFLIHCGIKINQTDHWGYSTLTTLALLRNNSDSIEIAQLLLDAGASRDLLVTGGGSEGLTAFGILKKRNKNPALASVIESYIPPLYNRAFYTLLAATHSTDWAVAERAKRDMKLLKSDTYKFALRPEFHEPTD